MTIRTLLIGVINMLFLTPLFSQNLSTDKIFFSVDSMPVFRLSFIDGKISVSYFFINEESVSKDVEYKGGYDALLAHCDSVYFKRPDFNCNEINAKAAYSILFDENLSIVEINIIHRQGYDKSQL